MKSDVKRSFVLHSLCKDRNNNENYQAICEELKRHPLSVRQRDSWGRTPLFYAIKNNLSSRIVSILFHEYNQAVTMPDLCMETPLSILYNPHCNPKLLSVILQAQPSLALHRHHSFGGQTMLDSLCRFWMSHEPTDDNLHIHQKHSTLWEKLVLTVLAAYGSMSDSKKKKSESHCKNNKNLELHCAIELALAPQILQWFVQMYPQQLHQPMNGGHSMMLPLFKILSNPAIVNTTSKCKSSAVLSLVSCILSKDKSLAQMTFQGQTLLHVAASQGRCSWNHGLEMILKAHPPALYQADSTTGLLPFMSAASACPDVDIDSIYHLIREGPNNILLQ